MMLAGLPLLLILAQAPASAPVADEEKPADIVVIARKMRTIKLQYQMFGSHLKKCEAEISSGDPQVDRIMCAVLKKCVADGYRDIGPAKACMNRRIERLEYAGQALASGTEMPLAAALPEASATPPPLPPARPRDGDEIIVEGRRFNVSPGHWYFTEIAVVFGNDGSTAMPPRSWSICISPEELPTALEKMLLAGEQDKIEGRCSKLDYQVKDGVITGKGRCIGRNMRLTRKIEGRYDYNSVTITQDVATHMLGRADDADNPSLDTDTVVRTAGTFRGQCPKG